MKNWLIKFKNLAILTKSVTFFWQALIIIFLLSLTAVLIISAVFWFKLEQSLNVVAVKNPFLSTEALNLEKINKTLAQLKTRAETLASTTANLPILVDPSR